MFQSKITSVKTSGIEFQLERIANSLEHLEILLADKPEVVPGRDFDPDDYCTVTFSNEEDELVEQHLNKRIAGVEVERPGLY